MKGEMTLAICMYNAERYIEETLHSVMSQTMQNFHLLIVDDCSTDDSLNIVKAFFLKHPRQYEFISFEENKGIGFARYFVERHSHTKYLMFLDADDCLHSDAISIMYAKIVSDPELMAVGCYLQYVDEKGKKIGGGIFLGETTKAGFYERAKNKKLIFMQPTAIYDRELALSVGGYVVSGYPEGKPRFQDYCEDLDLWTRMSDLYIRKKAIVVVPKVLCNYRKGSGLSSNSFYMIIKMHYIKTNLLLRRAGEIEQTFIEYFSLLSLRDKKRLKREAIAADALRNGVFYYRQRFIGKAVASVMKSIWYKPTYFLHKLKNNVKLKK